MCNDYWLSKLSVLDVRHVTNKLQSVFVCLLKQCAGALAPYFFKRSNNYSEGVSDVR